MAQNFWENDPVVSAPQPQRRGAPQPVIAFPEPTVDPLDARSKQLTIKQKERELSTPVEDPNAPKLPTGYRWKNGIAGGEAEPIPGIPQKGAEPEAPAHSQSAIDAFDRAIATAERLRTHPGFNAYVGLPSINPLDGQLGPYTVPGSAASDFRAELDAMKAQVFLPMVQSMKGMGALSNAEGQKLTDAIGALDPSMSEAGFAQSLDRIISDLTAYRNRGMPQQQEGAPGATPAAPGVDRSRSLDDYRTGGNVAAQEGFKTGSFITEKDMRAAQELQARFDAGASPAELDALSQQYGYAPLSSQADFQRALAYRDGTGEFAQFGPRAGARVAPVSRGEADMLDTALSGIASSELGAAVTGSANALTAGNLDEIAAMFGGEGAGDRVQWAKEYMREAMPVSSLIGEMAGAAGAVGGLARIPALAGRAIATDALYGAAYGAGESNDNRVMGGLVGAAAGGAGGYFGQKLLSRLGNRGGPPPGGTPPGGPKPPGAAERVATAERFGIDLPMEAAGGRGAAIVGNTLSNIPGSAQAMQSSRNALADQVTGAVDNVAEGFGPATSFPGIGEAAQSGARKWIDKFKTVAGKAYDAIPISAVAPANLTNTLDVLGSITAKFASNPKLAARMNNSRLKGFLDDLSEKVVSVDTGLVDAAGNKITRQEVDGGGLSWQDMKDLRTRIGEEISEHLISGDGVMKSELRALYGALSEDMMATATQQGPKAVRAFERANALYRQGQERIDNALTSILGKDGMQSAEKAAQKIQAMSRAGKATGDLKKLAEIRKSMPREEWGQVSNGLIRLLGQPANSEGRAFQADVFIRNYDDMAPEAKNLLFGKSDLRANLDEFSGVMRNLAEVNALRNTSNTAGQVLTGAGLLALNPVALVAQAATSYGAARLWTDPRFVRWATGYTRMLKGAAKAGKQPSKANFDKQIELLGKTAGANSVIASEVTGLQAALRAANDNAVTPLAAEPSPSGDRK